MLSYIHGCKKGRFVTSPVYANCCQGIELAMKGFLRAKGATIEDLKKKLGGKNGHDLEKLYVECQRLGMERFNQETEDHEFSALSKAYRSKEFHFPDSELHRRLPSIDKALTFCHAAIQAADAVAREGSRRHHNLPSAAPSYRNKQCGGKHARTVCETSLTVQTTRKIQAE